MPLKARGSVISRRAVISTVFKTQVRWS